MTRFCIFLLMAGWLTGVRAASIEELSQWVRAGHWNEARTEIARELTATNLSFAAREDLLYVNDRMHRMRVDFCRTRGEVFQGVLERAPTITAEQFANWEKAGFVEYLDVDGTRYYFRSAADNLFRLNADARALLTKAGWSAIYEPPDYYVSDIREILTNYDNTHETFTTPKRWRITYQVSVKPGMVPPGETIRAWLPFPQVMNRQSDIRLISTDPEENVPSTNAALTSVYVEKTAASNGPTVFKIVFECTCRAFYEPIDPAKVVPADTNDPALTPFLGEEPTQIVFSDQIKKLSQQIVGSETNPYLKARLLFQWVCQHITWASAWEYSTLDCLPEYVLNHNHGDCGMEAMTFMTLCRYNGIPAHWESGWGCSPYQDMHDWCEIYLAPYGWVPADVCYGMIDSPVDREKWFYLGGMDNNRLVLNSDYGQPVYPAKEHYRSEVVDFQQGEVEWRGGNLYFDQWDFDFKVERIPAGR